jgi:PKD repeat protein
VVVVSVSPASGSAPLTVIIDASKSWDSDGTGIANYVFNFGDGTSDTPIRGASVDKHTYDRAGIYYISVVATDTAGNWSTGYATVVAHPA